MLNEERRRAILDVLKREGRVLVLDLARRFETSQVTIRKDLEELHAHGLIHRTHGGALPAREGALEDPTLREKEKLHHQEKLRIATAAAHMVQEGQVVIFDSGTTTTAIARALRRFSESHHRDECGKHRSGTVGTTVEVILTGGTFARTRSPWLDPLLKKHCTACTLTSCFWASTASTCTTG